MMPMSKHKEHAVNSRLFSAMGLGAYGAVAVAVALQVLNDWAPCPWCILQRYAYLVLGTLLLIQAGRRTTLAKRTTSIGVLLVALTGALMAAFQLRVMFSEAVSCGRDAVAAFVNGLFPAKLLPVVFQATGSCADSIPVNFPALAFAGFLLIGLITAYKLGR